MMIRTITCIGIVVAVLSGMASGAWFDARVILRTATDAAIQTPGHGANQSDSDEDFGAVSISSSTRLDCTSGDGTFSSAVATSQRTAGGGATGTVTLTGTIATAGETTQAGGTATGYWPFGGYELVGPGLSGTTTVDLGTIVLRTNDADLGSSTTVDLTFDRDGAPVHEGSATLGFDGTLSGSGIYAPGNFSVSKVGDTWEATYIGTSTLPVVLPIGSFFDIYFEIGVSKTAGSGGGVYSDMFSEQTAGLAIPEGYELIPEPATLSLLALGGVAALRRRRQ